MSKLALTSAGVFAGLGVALGAFGAHALKARLSADMLSVFEVGVRYQMYHAFALLGLGLVMMRWQHPAFRLSCWSFILGILIFSGSLYALSLSSQRFLGAITPIGGVFFLLAWISFVYGIIRSA